MQKKIISIIGARPQFIKHAPMQLALQKTFNTVTIHTGQHYDSNMSQIFFEELKIKKPDYHLQILGSSHGQQTAEMITQIEEILIQENPDGVLVYGDTNSTLAGVIAASKLNIGIIHIEAGLRSFNKLMPEEINRILTDHCSTLLFCPSDLAESHLKREGIIKNVFITGDVMKDMLNLAEPFLENKMNTSYYFATIHRPYNTDYLNRIKDILQIFNQLKLPVVFAIHPRTKKLLESYRVDITSYKNILFIDPVGYFDCLSYQKYSSAVITDSGGMQKEAYWLKKRCITLRSETEWSETLNGNWNILEFEKLANIQKHLDAELQNYDELLYGDGNSALEISNIIFDYYN